jgi:uncharacterized RDD family membrane protein YckC
LYCIACGVKNELGTLKCFVCGKVIPSASEERHDSRPRRFRPTHQNESLGSLGDRMLALLFDRMLIASLLAIPAAAFAEYLKGDWRWLAAAGIIAAAAVLFGYHLFFEAAFGATLGKAIFGLRVRSDDGSANTFRSAAIRNALRVADGFALYAPAFFSVFFSSRKQRIGDHVAHAVVIEERSHWTARGSWLLLWVIAVAGALLFAGYLRPGRIDGVLTFLNAGR